MENKLLQVTLSNGLPKAKDRFSIWPSDPLFCDFLINMYLGLVFMLCKKPVGFN